VKNAKHVLSNTDFIAQTDGMYTQS